MKIDVQRHNPHGLSEDQVLRQTPPDDLIVATAHALMTSTPNALMAINLGAGALQLLVSQLAVQGHHDLARQVAQSMSVVAQGIQAEVERQIAIAEAAELSTRRAQGNA